MKKKQEKKKVSDIEVSDLYVLEIAVEAGKIKAVYALSKLFKFMTYDIDHAFNSCTQKLVNEAMKQNVSKGMYYGWSKEKTEKVRLDMRGRIKAILCSIVSTGKDPFAPKKA